jgi:two-component system response regulator
MGDQVDVLIVEDNASDLELTLRALKDTQVCKNVAIARDGAEALDLILSRSKFNCAQPLPRLILLDLKLPLVDGMEVLRRIRSEPRTRRVPVVVLSASTHERDVADTYEHGVNSYVVKPINFEEFAEAMKLVAVYWLTLNHAPEQGV